MNIVGAYRRTILLSIAALAAGCGLESNRQQTAPSQHELPFVLHSGMLPGSFLLDEQERVRWRFMDSEFVVESYREPLPAHVVDVLLDEPHATYRVSGRWQLFDNGHTLLLTDIRVDDGTGGGEVRLPLDPIERDEIIINSNRYRFSEALPLREILPDRIYMATVEQVLRGDLLRVNDQGAVREVKLAGVACPATDDRFGPEALHRSQEFVLQRRVAVKVFDRDDQGRDVAHVWAGLRFINLALLTEGLGRHDKQNDNEWVFATAEDEARALERGLWSKPDAAKLASPLDERVDGRDDDHHGTDD